MFQEKEGRGVKPVWVSKTDIRVAEPRILKFKKNYGEPNSENMLIKGDNLLILRSLTESFKGKRENGLSWFIGYLLVVVVFERTMGLWIAE